MFMKMTEDYANEIIRWQYEPPYDIYALKDPKIVMTDSFQAYVKDDLIGYICFGKTAQVPPYTYGDQHFDFGLAMRPDLTGKGRGKAYMNEIIDYLETITDLPLRLTVLTFNIRAIKLYENMSFKKIDEFTREERNFIVMERLPE